MNVQNVTTQEATHAGARHARAALRRRAVLERWRLHSHRIQRLRRALPITMAVVVGLLASWVTVRGVLTRIGDARDSTALIHMSNARFFGRDGDGRAYVLGAGQAARDDADYQRIELRDVRLTFDAESANPTSVMADTGVYRENDRIVRLAGHVQFHDAAGDSFTTDQAVVDTVNGTIVGPHPVRGTGPTGAIGARSFEIFDRGQNAVFRGEVHSRLKQG